MNLLREYIRELLKEDAIGFLHALAASSEEFGEPGEKFYGGDPGKGGGKAIKRAFNDHADHEWLSTLDTVHWTPVYGLADLIGKGKDELSTTMTLPNKPFATWQGAPVPGLWVKGRITLAAKNMDELYSGAYLGYEGPHADYTPEEQEQRKKSSGVNKLPKVSKDYSRYGKLKRLGPDAFPIEKSWQADTLERVPYIVDKSMWTPIVNKTGGEALVDNWKAVGIVVHSKLARSVQHYADDPSEAIGALKELFKAAADFGVPIVDLNRNKLWSPE